jgi:ribosomal protein L9
MIANYGEPKGKAVSATTCITKQLEGHPVEPEAKKLRDSRKTQKKLQEKRKIPRQHRQQAYKSRVGKIRLLSHELS